MKRFPDSANVYDSLGEAYENNEQFELAKKDDPNFSVFKKNLERMQKKLAE